MSKGNKKNKTKRWVRLASQANIFFDQKTGVTVYKGKPVELTIFQLNSLRIKQAIANGHIEYCDGPEDIEEEGVDEVIEKTLSEQFKELVEKGLTAENISKKFNKAKLNEIAKEYDIEVEDADTNLSITQAIIDTIVEEGL